jgi:hypothetical protein
MTASCKKTASAARPLTLVRRDTLSRSEFTTSRLADFASREELTRQIGHDPYRWPVVIVKELVDNALDDCERAGVAPVVDIAVDLDSITVSDNGRGIAPDVIERILDYSYKTSSNSAYVSPTRGQQGNAFQTLLAMDHALTGKPGRTMIESGGVRHLITFDVDPISREPRLDHQRKAIAAAPGTKVTVFWSTPLTSRWTELHNLAFYFGWLNPHVSLSFDASRIAEPGDGLCEHEPTEPEWTKWKPTDATSAHWYDLDALKDLIAAEVHKANRSGETQRTVADFVAEFRGLAGTGKRRDICAAVEAGRERLDTFFARGDDAIRRLLDAMKGASQGVKPRDLGAIGETHVREFLSGDPASERYKRVEIEVDGVPYLIKCGFGYRPGGSYRTFVAGLNWSVSVTGNPFQNLGYLLSEQRAGQDEPIGLFLHVASPRLAFLDRGKSRVHLPDEVEEAVVAAVRYVTAVWAKQRKAEERKESAKARRHEVMTKPAKPMSIREAAFQVMARAYREASDNGALPANARQIYYAARPHILRLCERIEKLNSKYFSQTLLVDYVNENPDECVTWDVVWSDRGHFVEPHTRRVIGLGTLAVRDYVASYRKPSLHEACFASPSIATSGPDGGYGAMLYIEKEGFDPLLKRSQLGERYDLAPMSCKGMSVTAARQLVDQTCARFKLPLFLLHDFDVAAFSIATTLHQSNRRYQFATSSGDDFKVFDLGLRLDDVERLGLQSEPVNLGDVSKAALSARLRINGATEQEIEFLLTGPGKMGQRVELNAITSRQFVDYLEAKLAEHGVRKVIPDADRLADAYRLFKRGERVAEIAQAAVDKMKEEEIAAPADLAERVRAYLAEHPATSWIQAVSALATMKGRANG